ncbi:Pleckstrin-2 [Oopsacas minuta]|uniref:Pleckstrin-2 n=1 Tax=Oopsacas minuta TaxID=111878 RepID=A0AAV7JYX8_9METZ|nr:Pleckstrin-2 [Oopsacas minuta]
MSETNSDIKRTAPVHYNQRRVARFFTMVSSESELMISVPPYAKSHMPMNEDQPLHMNRSMSLTDLNSLSLSSGDGEDKVFTEVCESDTGGVVLQGFLLKLKNSHIRQTWKKRKFVLREGSNRISYFSGAQLTTKFNSKENPTGAIILGNSTVISIPSEDKLKHIFQICSEKGKKYFLAATSTEERDNWVHTINNHIASLCPYKMSYV